MVMLKEQVEAQIRVATAEIKYWVTKWICRVLLAQMTAVVLYVLVR